VRLTLVGTGHVFRIGEIVEEIIQRRHPHIVCVELDPVRLAGLQDRARLAAYEEAGDPRAEIMRKEHEEATKSMPYLYRFLAKLQERLADQEGVEAGSEMLAAVNAANRIQVPIATIDVDAQALIRRAWSQMRWKERLRFLWAVLRGQKGAEVEAELAEYQDDPVAYLARVGEEFPTLKRVLIDERDAHMAKHILKLQEAGVQGIQRLAQRQKQQQAQARGVDGSDAETEKTGAEEKPHDDEGQTGSNGDDEVVIVAVVGDGHVPGMLEILTKTIDEEQIETIRVGDLRAGRIPEAKHASMSPHDDPASVTLHYDVTTTEQPDQGPPGV
jgi:pheromone shutdown protein TraB